MRLTYKGDYALKALLDLATHYEYGLSTIHDIAKRINAPVKFLEQVLLDLKKGGFVESRRGNVGGYLLSRHPGKIVLGDVVRFIDGPTEPIACVESDYSGCTDIYKCIFRKIWQDVAKATLGIIDNITFEDLVNKLQVNEEALLYQI
ncbi:MAG: Rrf2 family transcriptional regulator [Candidatus Omnitrophica bacterium]|nr:Rrf2 family transcriptional regulator [Candidatus Omnitrophota bacterium]MBU4303592.1 Rrf2 family transcriptional regulator [Candidatus Omnitrophota bacterium]MBU4419128.1 Rrf2 family transcriptional regulator [Candidatus Omnitrophota bacterium]MBU4467710.1 Rrf2 family transcriptional regulator [Candidatus Omnitrophota bacterium]MCG2707446.1 Rrf2 family transcriptional regulator [Candidatus Omnitrophota bacterium]